MLASWSIELADNKLGDPRMQEIFGFVMYFLNKIIYSYLVVLFLRQKDKLNKTKGF